VIEMLTHHISLRLKICFLPNCKRQPHCQQRGLVTILTEDSEARLISAITLVWASTHDIYDLPISRQSRRTFKLHDRSMVHGLRSGRRSDVNKHSGSVGFLCLLNLQRRSSPPPSHRDAAFLFGDFRDEG
jgi:hypothetical protein